MSWIKFSDKDSNQGKNGAVVLQDLGFKNKRTFIQCLKKVIRLFCFLFLLFFPVVKLEKKSTNQYIYLTNPSHCQASIRSDESQSLHP